MNGMGKEANENGKILENNEFFMWPNHCGGKTSNLISEIFLTETESSHQKQQVDDLSNQKSLSIGVLMN